MHLLNFTGRLRFFFMRRPPPACFRVEEVYVQIYFRCDAVIETHEHKGDFKEW